MSGRRTKARGMKANIAFVKEHCFYTLFFPLSPCISNVFSAIGKHNSRRRKNRGATLGGNLAN